MHRSEVKQMNNEYADSLAKTRLLSTVERWVDNISFFAADEAGESVDRITAWQGLERVLHSVDESLIRMLILKQRHLIDTLVQHLSSSAYTASQDVWMLAAKCFSYCHKAVGASVWEPGEFTASDLAFYTMGAVELMLDNDQLKFAIHAMDLWALLLTTEPTTHETYSSFISCISQLLTKVATTTIYKQRLLSFTQGFLFTLAQKARAELLNCLGSHARGQDDQTSLTVPLGGSDALLLTICTHRRIKEHPRVALTVVKCHAALCCVPLQRAGQKDSGGARLLAAMFRQNEIIVDFLLHLQLCLTDGSLSLTNPPELRGQIITALSALACAPYATLRTAARHLMHTVVAELRGLPVAPRTAQGTAMEMRSVFPDHTALASLGGPLVQGLMQVLIDLFEDNLLGSDEPSEELCGAVDETLEVVLQQIITRTVAHGDSGLAEVAKRLSEALAFCSKMVRTKLTPSLQILLQKGANCGVRGCAPLLEANAGFLKARYVVHTAVPAMSVAPSAPARPTAAEVIDLTESDAPSRDRGTRDSVWQDANAWVFLKPPAPMKSAQTEPFSKPAIPSTTGTASKQPVGPFSRLEPTNSYKSVGASQRESALDRLAREEQEQLAQERRALIRKRIFGDIDANPPPNSEDLMGRVGKYAKLSSEFGAHVGWLEAKGTTKSKEKEEGGWDHQIRELREAKERARLQALQKRPAPSSEADSSGSGPLQGRTDASGARSAGRKSALLEKSELSDEDEDEGGGGGGGGGAAKKVIDWRTLLQPDKPLPASVKPTAADSAPAMDVSGLMAMYTSGQMAANAQRSAKPEPTFSEAMAAISIDPIVRMLLQCDFANLCADSRHGRHGKSATDSAALVNVPIRFLEEEHYINSFTPLLLAEVTAAVVAQINGDNTSDEARYAEGSSGGGSNGGGRGGAASEILRVRCLLKTERPGQPKLQEALVAPLAESKYSQQRLNKDDLVLVMTTAAHPDTSSVQQWVNRPHALALVLNTTSQDDQRRGLPSANHQESKEREKENRKQQSTLLMLTGTVLSQDTVRLVVPVMSLTSFLREWSALMSIRNHRLMPLAPYLLKASPVVSSQHLSAMHDAVRTKLSTLEYDPDVTMSLDRQARMNAALLEDLQQIRQLHVDGSVLKNTGIVKTLKTVTTATSRLIAAECEAAAADIIARWKQQVKNDNRGSTIRNMKGGKLIEMPAEGSIGRPRCASPELWTHFEQNYNRSQLFAIKYVSDQFEGGQDTRIALVQGPPGTGKTFTVLGMVAALLNYYTEGGGAGGVGGVTQSRKRLLICAPSNTAVDELLSRMAGGIADGSSTPRMLKIVRLGEPLEGASEFIKKITLESQVEERLRQDEAWIKLDRAKAAIAQLDRELQSLPVARDGPQMSSASDKRPELSKEAQRGRSLRTELASQRQVKVWAEMAVERARSALRQQILLEADVVGATLSGSGRKQFLDMALQNDVTFETAIVDEAAQATEPSCLIPLRLGCRRLVLVGDPRQLPATVLSKPAAQAGLGRSLFERLERADHEVVMLTIQYRMHPEIRRFPSRFFYQDLLTDAPAALALRPITVESRNGGSHHSDRSGQTVQLAPTHFLDVRIASDSSAGKSFVNDVEVSIVTRLLTALLPHARAYSVAVITPYKAQVNRLKRALREDPTLASLHNERRRNDAEIEVNSVDGFQGREKDIVIFSAVRSNLRHQHDAVQPLEPGEVAGVTESRGGFSIGFVADERRLNVAITRAKRLLVIVGNAGTLATDATWRSMLVDLGQRRQVTKVRRLDDLRSDAAVIELLSGR